jgi:hypothetical protein
MFHHELQIFLESPDAAPGIAIYARISAQAPGRRGGSPKGRLRFTESLVAEWGSAYPGLAFC